MKILGCGNRLTKGIISGVSVAALAAQLGGCTSGAGVSASSGDAATVSIEQVLPTTGMEPPKIIPREVWGAREPRCQWAGQDGNQVTHVVIHHSYEPTDPPSLESAYAAIRHIQNLHMDDNGWCDVGYSYLVDWFGNVYEGTAGTIDRPITSAHTAGLNYEGVGIVMIGNYETEIPSAQTVAAAGRVAAWVLGWYGYDSTEDVHLTVAGNNNKWASGTPITVPAITAHRDVVTTECPGDGGYSVMDVIRSEAASVTAEMQASGDFGAGVGNSGPIFAIGSPAVPIGDDAQDAHAIAAEAGLAEATEVLAEEPEVSEHAPATEPDDGDHAADAGVGQAEVDAGERATLNAWWWGVIGVVVLGAVIWTLTRIRRRNAYRWDSPDASDVVDEGEGVEDAPEPTTLE